MRVRGFPVAPPIPLCGQGSGCGEEAELQQSAARILAEVLRAVRPPAWSFGSPSHTVP